MLVVLRRPDWVSWALRGVRSVRDVVLCQAGMHLCIPAYPKGTLMPGQGMYLCTLAASGASVAKQRVVPVRRHDRPLGTLAGAAAPGLGGLALLHLERSV